MPGGAVLIIEDDPDIRESMRLLLEDEGYEVFDAEHGAAGLAMLYQAVHALVALVDYRMPVMDGAELLRLVAADGVELRRHAFVLVTANSDLLPRELARALTSLAVPTLNKPFDIDVLLVAVRRAQDTLRETPA